MPDTPSAKHGIARPGDGDDIRTWPSEMRTSIDDIDAIIAVALADNPRPGAGVFGRIHRHPTTGVLSFDDGTTWHEFATMPHAARHAENGDDPVLGQLPIGGIITYAGSVLPPGGSFAWADGSLVDRTVFSTFYTRVGHAYNGGVDPGSNMVRLPDKRGRALFGADNYGSGAAGRITSDPAARGQSGGLERVTLALANLPAHNHGGGSHAHNQQEWSVLVSNTGPTASIVGNSAGGANLGVKNDFMSASGTIIGTDGSGTNHQNLPPHENDNVIVRIA